MAPVKRCVSPVLGTGISAVLGVLAFACAAGLAPGAASAQAAPDRYDLVHGCFALRSLSDGDFVVKAGAGYEATAADATSAEPFRMQATDLGRYLFYGAAADFLAHDPTPLVGGVVSADEPSGNADWKVAEDAAAFAITNKANDRELAVDPSGKLVTVPPGQAGESGRFAFAETTGCADYPEVEVNATGDPATGSPPYGEVSGLLEGHMHHMAFEFLGGRAHCGRPWHRFGAPFALVDCPDHEPNGCAALLENLLYGDPARCHDPVGWPTFKDWPDPRSLTHEQSYYKWLERSWHGGLRVFTNLLVENRQLCEVYPLKQNDCNEMKSVELQARRMHQLQDYIDAQSGGPGEGWYRIVRNPFQARRVINDGKLAVIMGMEVSEPFDCRVRQVNDDIRIPQCDKSDIDGWLDRLREMGVRQLEVVNKFDNALTGVAGDDGDTGVVVNGGNFLATNSFWRLDDNCEDPENHDHAPSTAVVPHNDDLIIANGLEAFASALPAPPVYEQPPLCNRIGLTALGEHAVEGIIDRRMVFDPDHMSVKARDQAMSLAERERYSGVISSHSWSTENTLPRIYRLGGIVTPYAGSSESFVHQWSHLDDYYSGRQYFGVGYGADMNGFGSQGLPRGPDVPNPVTYPFESFDGSVTLDRQVSGERVFDINSDGVAHYGLYPDWIEDLRMLAGEEIINDLGRGAEAYLQMWERAEGVPRVRCGGWQRHEFSSAGLGGRIHLKAGPEEVLSSAGQPSSRTRAWRWCTRGAELDERSVAAAFTRAAEVGLVASQLGRNEAGGIGTNDPAVTVRRKAKRLGAGLWVRGAGDGRKYFYGVEDGRVSFAGVALGRIARSAEALTRHLRRVQML